MKMLERRFAIGERLAQIKEQLPYGKWEEPVDTHLQFTVRTARRYLRAYKYRHDALVTTDPVLFLEQIQGHADSKSDDGKSDARSRPKLERSKLNKAWCAAVGDANEAIERLVDLQSQYGEWLNELTDDQLSSELGQALLAISQLRLENLRGELQDAVSISLPQNR